MAETFTVASGFAQTADLTQIQTAPVFGDLGKGQTRILPSINVSVAYDSNPWFGATPPDRRKVDYFTNVRPGVNIQHRGKLIEGTFVGTAIAGFYVNNPDLNYLGTFGQANLKLDQLVQKLNRNLTLNLTDFFIYSPVPPAFINPVAGQRPITSNNAFGSGIQPSRVTSTFNTAVVTGAYRFSPRGSLLTTYTNSFLNFGDTLGDPTLGFAFGMISHSITAGPQFQITPRDTVGLNYAYDSTEFTGVQSGTYRAQGGTATWTRLLTSNLTLLLSGGVKIVKSSVGELNSVQPVSGEPSMIDEGGNLFYIAGMTLLWNYRKDTAFTFAYNRSVAPSFYIASVPLANHALTVSASYQFTEKLAALVQANYGFLEDPSATVSFTTYGAITSLNYMLSPNLTASVMHTYYNYDQRFLDQQFATDRNLLMISLTAVWN